MVLLVVIFAAAVMASVSGRPPALPSLPMKDGCYLVSTELSVFRVEGEAIILTFPMFMRVLEKRKLAPPTAKYLITKSNGTEGVPYDGEGRIQQQGKQLRFLPAQASDSGEYICTYRNQNYCLMGNISLQVYTSSSVDIKAISYSINRTVGEPLRVRCPDLDDFCQTGGLIEWYKNSSLTSDHPNKVSPSLWDKGVLTIPAVKRYHAGLYTCQLTVLIDNQQYKVSRAVLLHVQGVDPVTTTVSDSSKTSNQEPFSSSYSTVHTPVIRPPVIISPLNGTIYASPHDSGLELFCKVFTQCEVSDNTLVTWWINGQSVESSHFDGRALQGERRVTKAPEGCQIEMRLLVVAQSEEDTKTELKCITQNQGGRQEVVVQLQLEDSTSTWIVVAAVAVSCFLTVVSIFLCALFKPKRKKKMDYFLARQDSTF